MRCRPTIRHDLGRPTLLTPELQASIVERIKRGNYPSVAAGACGIGRTTFKIWMSRGRSGEEPYGAFRTAVKDAADVAETEMVDIIKQAAADSWQAAAWWLERTRHKRFARRLDDKDKAAIAMSVADQFKAAREKGKK